MSTHEVIDAANKLGYDIKRMQSDKEITFGILFDGHEPYDMKDVEVTITSPKRITDSTVRVFLRDIEGAYMFSHYKKDRRRE